MPHALHFDVSVYSSGERHAPHRHDEMQLSLILKGQVRETVGNRTELGSALSVVMKDSGVVHANEFGPEKPKIARLSLMRGSFSDLVDEASRAESWRWTHDPRIAHPFLRLVARSSEKSFACDDADVVDLIAAFTARPTAGNRRPPGWLAIVVDEIRFSWRPGSTVQDIARRAGVHPVYLARCLRRWYGTGVAEEMRRARVRAAADALAKAQDTVSRIAHQFGYSDEPHLCRDLRASLGLTPRGYRKLVGQLS